jgi:hypothetical protein
MTAALTIETKLAKLIRLIFGSDKDGEIVAAVTAAKRLLAANNVDHHSRRLRQVYIGRIPKITTRSISAIAEGDADTAEART